MIWLTHSENASENSDKAQMISDRLPDSFSVMLSISFQDKGHSRSENVHIYISLRRNVSELEFQGGLNDHLFLTDPLGYSLKGLPTDRFVANEYMKYLILESHRKRNVAISERYHKTGARLVQTLLDYPAGTLVS
jgi:hypothetical protein